MENNVTIQDMIDTKEIYWAAGFYEGEGSCRYRRAEAGGRRHSAGVEVKVMQCNMEPLERLVRVFGGRVKVDEGFNKNKPPQRSDRYYWVASGNRALGILMTMYCLLSEKRKTQIRAVIDGVKAAPVRRWAKAPHPEYKNWLYANDETFRETTKIRVREKYHSDPEHRERVKARIREWEERMRADPEKLKMLRDRRNAYQRAYRAAKKNGSP